MRMSGVFSRGTGRDVPRRIGSTGGRLKQGRDGDHDPEGRPSAPGTIPPIGVGASSEDERHEQGIRSGLDAGGTIQELGTMT